MFGSQSTTDDFMNYALRIDPEFKKIIYLIINKKEIDVMRQVKKGDLIRTNKIRGFRTGDPYLYLL